MAKQKTVIIFLFVLGIVLTLFSTIIKKQFHLSNFVDGAMKGLGIVILAFVLTRFNKKQVSECVLKFCNFLISKPVNNDNKKSKGYVYSEDKFSYRQR